MQCVYVVTDDTGGDCNTGLCVSTALLSEVCSASCLDQQKAELSAVPSVQGPASAGGRRAGSSPRRDRVRVVEIQHLVQHQLCSYHTSQSQCTHITITMHLDNDRNVSNDDSQM